MPAFKERRKRPRDVNFMCLRGQAVVPSAWVKLAVAVKALFGWDGCFHQGTLSEASYPLSCGWASRNQLKALRAKTDILPRKKGMRPPRSNTELQWSFQPSDPRPHPLLPDLPACPVEFRLACPHMMQIHLSPHRRCASSWSRFSEIVCRTQARVAEESGRRGPRGGVGQGADGVGPCGQGAAVACPWAGASSEGAERKGGLI